MIKSRRLPMMIFCLVVGIALGLMFAGWTSTSMAKNQQSWPNTLNPTRLLVESAVGEAVPSAAHLTLWEEDYETMLPIVTKSESMRR